MRHDQRGHRGTLEMWEADSHVWTEFIEVPVAILLHLLRSVDGQGPVGVHGDHHTANVCLEEEEDTKRVRMNQLRPEQQQLSLPSSHLGVSCGRMNNRVF